MKRSSSPIILSLLAGFASTFLTAANLGTVNTGSTAASKLVSCTKDNPSGKIATAAQEKCPCGVCACSVECHGDACDCKPCACKKCGCPR